MHSHLMETVAMVQVPYSKINKIKRIVILEIPASISSLLNNIATKIQMFHIIIRNHLDKGDQQISQC